MARDPARHSERTSSGAPPPVASFEASTILEEPLAHGGTKFVCCTKTELTSTGAAADELQSVINRAVH